MRTAILGCGAMGTVMGAYMTKNGFPIEMVVHSAEYVDAMRSEGAKLVGDDDFSIPVNVYTVDEMEGNYDLIFLFTKQTANADLLPKVREHMHDTSIVCALQNGVPEPNVAEYVGVERTIGGISPFGATLLRPGVSEVTHDPKILEYLFVIGEVSGQITERIKSVAEILKYMGPVKITDNLMGYRWGKLVNNACMSAMSTVCGATFGEVLGNPKARACLSYLGREVKACCEADGYKLPLIFGRFSADSLGLDNRTMFDESQKLFFEVYANSEIGKASMLQDLERGKPTEVNMINGYVCKTGDRLGIDTPFNDKVVEIVTRIEQGELSYSMDNLDFFDPEWCG